MSVKGGGRGSEKGGEKDRWWSCGMRKRVVDVGENLVVGSRRLVGGRD